MVPENGVLAVAHGADHPDEVEEGQVEGEGRGKVADHLSSGDDDEHHGLVELVLAADDGHHDDRCPTV